MNKIKSTLAFLLVITIALPIRIGAFATIIIIIFFFSENLWGKFDWSFIKDKLFILCFLLFFIISIGVLRSNIPNAYHQIENNLFIIALPIIAYQFRHIKISASAILYAFSIACLLLILFGFAFTLTSFNESQRHQIFKLGHTEFTSILDIHPTYLSLFFILIVFFSLEEIRKFAIDGIKGILGPIIFLVLSFLATLFLRSQTGFLIFFITCAYYVIVITRERAWLITFLLFAVGLMTVLLDSHATLNFFSEYGKNVSTALDNRILLWKAVLKGLDGHLLFGAGTGNEQLLINEGYKQVGFNEGIEKSFNAHNQYIQFVCRNGLVELFAFMAILIYAFWEAQKQKNLVFMMFLISFSLLMLTESCLNVQRGIVYFFFFVSAFIFLPYRNLPVDKTEL